MSANSPQNQPTFRLDLALLALVMIGCVMLVAAVIQSRPPIEIEAAATVSPEAATPEVTEAPVQPTARVEIIPAATATPEVTPEVTPESTSEVASADLAKSDTAQAQHDLAGMVIFMSNRDGDWDIYTLDLASGALTNLTNNTVDDGFASYSLDGKQISLISNQDRPEGGHLNGYLIDDDGGNRTKAAADIPTFMNILLNGRGDWDVRASGGTPDVLVSLRDLNMEVYVRQDGKDTNLSSNGGTDWYSSWSPDGQDVVFSTDRNAGEYDIYVTRADGSGEPRRLTDTPQDDWSPVFTRDGRWILFASERDHLMSGGTDLLYAIDWAAAADSDGVPTMYALESLPTDADPALDSGAVTHNGITVYMSRRDGNWELYAEGADGVPVNLTNDPGDDIMPLWKP